MILPKILKLNAAGFPQRWVTYEKYAEYANKDRILWSMAPSEFVLRGGTNAATGKQSTLKLDTIVAVSGPVRDPSLLRVPLKSTYLFRRDRNLCAYCGYVTRSLTRDHVVPKSRGGKDTWENLVTACKNCNARKDARTPEEANMPLLYVPYAPSYAEYLILDNGRILADQMDFLLERVPVKLRKRYE